MDRPIGFLPKLSSLNYVIFRVGFLSREKQRPIQFSIDLFSYDRESFEYR